MCLKTPGPLARSPEDRPLISGDVDPDAPHEPLRGAVHVGDEIRRVSQLAGELVE